MVYVLSQRSLLIIHILSTTLNLILGDKSIGHFMRTQIRKYINSTSNNTNHKLWMDYLEKKLEIICAEANGEKQISSILLFYKTILKNNMLSKLYAVEDVSYQNVVQIGIFGSVSPNDIVAIPVCATIQDEKARASCYYKNGRRRFCRCNS